MEIDTFQIRNLKRRIDRVLIDVRNKNYRIKMRRR